MPGWFCKSSSTGQLDPFADQATEHQRQLGFFFFYSTTNKQQPNSSQLWIYICLFISPPPLCISISPIIQLLGHFHAAVMLCWKLLLLFGLKKKNIFKSFLQKKISEKSGDISFLFLWFIFALRSFQEEDGRFILGMSQNKRNCPLLSVFT